jgi:hypothetical protein
LTLWQLGQQRCGLGGRFRARELAQAADGVGKTTLADRICRDGTEWLSGRSGRRRRFVRRRCVAARVLWGPPPHPTSSVDIATISAIVIRGDETDPLQIRIFARMSSSFGAESTRITAYLTERWQALGADPPAPLYRLRFVTFARWTLTLRYGEWRRGSLSLLTAAASAPGIRRV